MVRTLAHPSTLCSSSLQGQVALQSAVALLFTKMLVSHYSFINNVTPYFCIGSSLHCNSAQFFSRTYTLLAHVHRTVMTAGHCLGASTTSILAIINPSFRTIGTEDEVSISVTRFLRHPDFNFRTTEVRRSNRQRLDGFFVFYVT